MSVEDGPDGKETELRTHQSVCPGDYFQTRGVLNGIQKEKKIQEKEEVLMCPASEDTKTTTDTISPTSKSEYWESYTENTETGQSEASCEEAPYWETTSDKKKPRQEFKTIYKDIRMHAKKVYATPTGYMVICEPSTRCTSGQGKSTKGGKVMEWITRIGILILSALGVA